jgi:hypothetical protein
VLRRLDVDVFPAQGVQSVASITASQVLAVSLAIERGRRPFASSTWKKQLTAYFRMQVIVHAQVSSHDPITFLVRTLRNGLGHDSAHWRRCSSWWTAVHSVVSRQGTEALAFARHEPPTGRFKSGLSLARAPTCDPFGFVQLLFSRFKPATPAWRRYLLTTPLEMSRLRAMASCEVARVFESKNVFDRFLQ